MNESILTIWGKIPVGYQVPDGPLIQGTIWDGAVPWYRLHNNRVKATSVLAESQWIRTMWGRFLVGEKHLAAGWMTRDDEEDIVSDRRREWERAVHGLMRGRLGDWIPDSRIMEGDINYNPKRKRLRS